MDATAKDLAQDRAIKELKKYMDDLDAQIKKMQAKPAPKPVAKPAASGSFISVFFKTLFGR